MNFLCCFSLCVGYRNKYSRSAVVGCCPTPCLPESPPATVLHVNCPPCARRLPRRPPHAGTTHDPHPPPPLKERRPPWAAWAKATKTRSRWDSWMSTYTHTTHTQSHNHTLTHPGCKHLEVFGSWLLHTAVKAVQSCRGKKPSLSQSSNWADTRKRRDEEELSSVSQNPA